MAGLHTPLSTLHVRPHDRPRMTRGRCGSLLLHRNGLAPSALCRSPGAPGPGPSLEHRLSQMTPAELAADAIALVERVRRRLAEYRQAIEHEPSPEPETED